MRLPLFFTAFFCFLFSYSQVNRNSFTLDANLFYGVIAEHNKDISHLIKGHPTGLIVSYSKKTYGKKLWEGEYNFPDKGLTFIYQDLKNETLGKSVGLLAHYSFYLLKRNLMLRIGQGISYNTNPYDKENNFRNNAYGTSLLSATCLMLNFKKENLFNGLGFQTGLSLIHYSNGSFKSPNSSTNSITANLGVNYVLDADNLPGYIKHRSYPYTEKIKYNFSFKTGFNESDVINSGQYASYTLAAYADKRLTSKSAVQLGTELFLSQFLKTHIEYRSIAFPEGDVSGDEDFKRVGLFVGHELFVNKISFITQLGYYIYYPYDFEGRIYNRVGLKRYFGDKLYGVLSLKSHVAKAETFEFGIGIRL